MAVARALFRLGLLACTGCTAGVQGLDGFDRETPSDEMISIAGGEVTLGCPPHRGCSERNPERRVMMAAFEIDRLEVTVAKYRACVSAGDCDDEGLDHSGHTGADDFSRTCNYPEGREQHPMNCVSWAQAERYCGSVQKRLPTADEWETAARGSDARAHPWGEESPSAQTPVSVNLLDESGKARFPHAHGHLEGFDDGWAITAPAGAAADDRSPHGVQDLAGNVQEWLADRIEGERQTYLFRAVRGSSFYHNPLRAAAFEPYQLADIVSNMQLGFRCARSLPPEG